MGQIGDNYWSGNCAFYEGSSVYNVVSPDAITDAKLEAVYWDDYIQVFVDGNNVFDTYPNLFQCDAHPPNHQFVMFPFTDVTGLIKSKGQHSLKVNAPCWIDISGVQHCPNQVTGQAETCKALEQQGCAFIRSDCVQGANGNFSGTCWLYKDVYDCGSIVSTPTLQGSSSQQCAGPVRCMGEECVSIDKAQSQDFVRARAAINAIQQRIR